MAINPITNNNKGNAFLCVRKYDKKIDDTPNTRANMIIPHSNNGLAKKPKPVSGKKVSKIGTMAQCIAHKVDAVIPMLSNLEPRFLDVMGQIYTNATLLHFIFSEIIFS